MFAAYNASIWPMPVISYVLGALALVAFLKPELKLVRGAWFALGFLWLWTGASYFYMVLGGHVAPLRIFGFLFLVEGGMLAGFAVNEVLSPRRVPQAQRLLGGLLVAFSAVIYPLIGAASGHVYPAAPSFGITPCPLVIFTLGLLLLSPVRFPLWFYAVPTIWSIVGGSAAFLLGVPQDLMLPIAALGSLIASGVIHRPATSTPARRNGPKGRLGTNTGDYWGGAPPRVGV
jgi:hypothetical protein